MMSEFMVAKWKQRHQRQEQVVEGGERNRSSSHVHSQIQQQQQHHHHQNTVPIIPTYEVSELTWENGQLAMHGLSASGLLPTGSIKPTSNRAGDTLESIVHQATWPNQNLYPPLPTHDQNPANLGSATGSSIGKWVETLGQTHLGPGFTKKRVWSESNQCGGNFGSSIQEERSACASASATFCKENDATMVTWASFESPESVKTKTQDDDSACEDLDGSENLEEQERETTKGETGRSHSTRRRRAAAVHNQSERRRRDRINQKMKALQKLVPNASKTDKASMLDEVIEYLKRLQAQVHLMSIAPANMPQMMVPTALGLHHQQQIQMSLLARMGMGMGMGVGLGMGMGPTFVPPLHPFAVPHMIPNHNHAQATTDAAIRSSVPFSNPYCTFLGQPINMDLYNKMAAVYQQQVNQTTQQTSSPLPSTHVQGG